MAEQTSTLTPPKWERFESGRPSPSAPEGYHYEQVRRCSYCGTVAGIICCPIECMGNLLTCFSSSAPGEAFDMMRPRWWKLVKDEEAPDPEQERLN